MPKQQIQTISELTSSLVTNLRQTVQAPTIHAYKPMDSQRDFHKSNKIGRLYIGGNRSGKTVGGATETVMRLTGKHPYQDVPQPPVKLRAVGVDFDQGVEKILKPEIAKWLPPSELINGSWEDSYSKSLRTLTIANGSFLEFMSCDQDEQKFAGTSRHAVWFDEEPPENIFNECLLRLVDTGGCYYITVTPLQDMSWTFDRLYTPWKNKKNLSIDVFEVDTADNIYIDMDVMDTLLQGMSDNEIETRKTGSYISHTGLVYKDSFHAENVLTEDILETDRWNTILRKWGHFEMMDHGLTNPTAWLFGAYDEEGRIIIYDEYYQRGKLVMENAAAILERRKFLRTQPQYCVGDPSIANKDPITGTSIHTEYAEHGIYIGLGLNNVDGGIMRVAHRFRRELTFISPRCEWLLWELQRYRWAKFASSKIAARNNAKETPLKKDDHLLDALRYGIVSRPQLPEEFDMPVGNILGVSEVASDFDPTFLIRNQVYSGALDECLGSEW